MFTLYGLSFKIGIYLSPVDIHVPEYPSLQAGLAATVSVVLTPFAWVAYVPWGCLASGVGCHFLPFTGFPPVHVSPSSHTHCDPERGEKENRPWRVRISPQLAFLCLAMRNKKPICYLP